MTGRVEGEARAAVIRAQAQARRLGQHFIGCEHLLYGLAGADDNVGRVLRDRGVTPERVGAEIQRLIASGRTTATDPGELDRGALEAIGIDLDAVRARIDEAFGSGSLDRPAARPRRQWPVPRIRRRAPRGHLPVTRQARACLDRSVRAAAARPDGAPDTADLTTALLGTDASAMRAILKMLGVSSPMLAAEIAECP